MIISFLSSKKQFLIKSVMNRKFALALFALLAFAFSACEDLPDSIIDNKFADYKILKIETPSSFAYANPDSLFTASITIQNTKSVERVLLSVKAVDGTSYVAKQIVMIKGTTTQSSTIYSAKVPMSKKSSSGKYLVEFFVSDNIRVVPDNVSKVGEQVLVYNNNQTNYAPVISNLVLVDNITRETPFTFTIKVDDQNGLGDIEQVTFKLTRPDGTLVIPNPNTPSINYFLMVDNGDAVLGDAKAGDGIYSFKNTFGSTAQTGSWQFEFQAKDKSGALSNVIKQTLRVN
ncbi:MAG: hypothetical protein FD143_718 [Ignavibacteria bacterium]|nr:MAG: hypothetical protein FD143_718 [Ignavibacteria bacterium]KAF0161331.1 MAG: hypothetical protein FD188_919 [Ignavibacteria bacterium]